MLPSSALQDHEKSRASGSSRLQRYSRRRMRSRPNLRTLRARAYMRHVRNRIPFPIQLAYLLRSHFQQQRSPMPIRGGFRVYRRNIQPPAGCRRQDAHQCSLCIAIANLKYLHAFPFHCVGSSSSNISDSAAPAGTMGKTLASGAQSNTSNSPSGDARNRSI